MAAMFGEGAPLGLLRFRGTSPVGVAKVGEDIGEDEWFSPLPELLAEERFDFGVDGSDGDVDDVFAEDEFDVRDVLFEEAYKNRPVSVIMLLAFAHLC